MVITSSVTEDPTFHANRCSRLMSVRPGRDRLKSLIVAGADKTGRLTLVGEAKRRDVPNGCVVFEVPVHCRHDLNDAHCAFLSRPAPCRSS